MNLIEAHQALKQRLRRDLKLSDELLHLHGGMAIFVLTALAFADGFRSPWPLLVTLVIECTNELFDRIRKGSWRWSETWIDFVHTMLWPFVIWLIAITRWIG